MRCRSCRPGKVLGIGAPPHGQRGLEQKSCIYFSAGAGQFGLPVSTNTQLTVLAGAAEKEAPTLRAHRGPEEQSEGVPGTKFGTTRFAYALSLTDNNPAVRVRTAPLSAWGAIVRRLQAPLQR